MHPGADDGLVLVRVDQGGEVGMLFIAVLGASREAMKSSQAGLSMVLTDNNQN